MRHACDISTDDVIATDVCVCKEESNAWVADDADVRVEHGIHSCRHHLESDLRGQGGVHK